MTASEAREIRILGIDQVLARMGVALQRVRSQPVCERCRKQPPVIGRSVRGAYEAVCRGCSDTPPSRAAGVRSSGRGGLAAVDQELARIDRELAELDAKRRAEPQQSYSPGLAGVHERALDLELLELELLEEGTL